MLRKSTARPREVFLSHSSRDAAFTRRVARMLADHGIKVFVSERHIRGAQQWHDAIGDALKRCDWFVVILSPRSVASIWVRHELLYALQDRRLQSRIVPVLYKPCDIGSLSWTLSAIQWVDFRGDFEQASRALLAVWKIRHR